MVRREPYEGNEPTGPGGAFNLAKLLGNSQHMSNGFVSFTIKTFSVSACSAVVFGLSSYMLFHGFIGPVLPFMGGGTFGFVGGLVHRYRQDMREACVMMDKYPRVIEHHLALVDPSERRPVSLPSWRRDLASNMRKQGLLIVALYSAADTLAKLQDEEEERLVERHYRTAAEADGEAEEQ